MYNSNITQSLEIATAYYGLAFTIAYGYHPSTSTLTIYERQFLISYLELANLFLSQKRYYEYSLIIKHIVNGRRLYYSYTISENNSKIYLNFVFVAVEYIIIIALSKIPPDITNMLYPDKMY